MADIQKGKRLVNAEILGKVAEGLKKYADQAEADAKAHAESQDSALHTTVQSEIATAKSQAIATAKDKDDALRTELQGYADQAEADAVATAKAYTEAQDSALKTDLEGQIEDAVNALEEKLNGTGEDSVASKIAAIQAKDQEQDGRLATIQGNENTAGSIAKALKDAKDYADAQDSSLHKTISAEIDADVKAEADRAAGIEADLQSQINDNAASIEALGESSTNALQEAIAAEQLARENKDNELQSAINAINNDTNGILAQAKAYTDQEVDAEEQRALAAEAKALKDAKDYADQKITALVDSAPDAMNTLNELAAAIKGNKNIYDSYIAEHATAMANMKKELQDEIDTDVKAEADRAKGEEAKIRSEFAAADTALHTTITGETAAAVKAEADRAKAEEADIRADFAAADATLKTQLQKEIDDDVKVVADALANEKNASKDGSLAKKIADEVARATGVEQGLNGRIADLEEAMGETGSVADAIATAEQAAKDYADAQDTALHTTISAEIDADVKTEKTRAEGQEAAIRSEFAAADDSLQDQLDSHFESIEAINEFISEGGGMYDAIDAEAQARQQADQTLQTNIDNEKTRAEGAEQALAARLTTLEGTGTGSVDAKVAAEAKLRQQEDAKLQTAISNEKTRAEGQEAAIRSEFAAADTALQNKVVNTFNALNLQFIEQDNGQPAIQVILDNGAELGKSPLSGEVAIPVMTDGEVNDMLTALGLKLN